MKENPETFKFAEYKQKFENTIANIEHKPISKQNKFEPLIDRTLVGVEQYFGLVEEECLDVEDND
jgi:hypothetical protein